MNRFMPPEVGYKVEITSPHSSFLGMFGIVVNATYDGWAYIQLENQKRVLVFSPREYRRNIDEPCHEAEHGRKIA